MEKKEMSLFLRIAIILLIALSSANASVPDFVTKLGETFTDMATAVIIGIILLVLWIIAGITAFVKNSAWPVKWAVVATVVIVIAPFVGGTELIDWAKTNFGS